MLVFRCVCPWLTFLCILPGQFHIFTCLVSTQAYADDFQILAPFPGISPGCSMGTFHSTAHVLFPQYTPRLVSLNRLFLYSPSCLLAPPTMKANVFLIPHPANHQLAANLISKLFLDSVTSMTALIHTLLISHLAHCDSSPIHTLVPDQNSCPTKWLDYLKNTNSMTFLLFNINQRLSSYKTSTKLTDMVKKPEVCPCPVLLFTASSPKQLVFLCSAVLPSPTPALHTHFCFANTSLVF